MFCCCNRSFIEAFASFFTSQAFLRLEQLSVTKNYNVNETRDYWFFNFGELSKGFITPLDILGFLESVEGVLYTNGLKNSCVCMRNMKNLRSRYIWCQKDSENQLQELTRKFQKFYYERIISERA